jgi:ACS family hexuronate transporter-like MFS transporter
VLGIAGGCGAMGAILFNYAVGQFIAGPSAEHLFYVMAFLHAIGVVILWTMVRPEVPNVKSIKL